MNQKFHVITRCIKQENLLQIYENIFGNWYDITWHIIFDCQVISELSAEILSKIKNKKVNFYYVIPSRENYTYPQYNKALDEINDGYIMFLDDDNIIHPEYFKEITALLNDDHKIYVVKDGDESSSEPTLGQLTLHYSVIKKHRFNESETSKDEFIYTLLTERADWFYYVDKVLAYKNYITPISKYNYLPRVLMISNHKHDIYTTNFGDYEENKLNVLWKPTDTDINKTLAEFDPDGILLVSDDYTKYKNLCEQPANIRNKWITAKDVDDYTGQAIYDALTNSMLANDNSKLISYFTSVYNRGHDVFLQYDNLKKQTYTNWEWVIVNDSRDGGKTQKALDKLMKMDPRVKVYEFRHKTNGIIGEAKYRAAMLCNGEILAELDHDDTLIENCGELLMNAYNRYPNAGFFYTDSAEMREDKSQVMYGPGFACGYGSYRKVKYNDDIISIQNTPNINPKTIRHIVGVPNHIRAWKRDVYHAIGGHNRRLSIADDYELIVRTFLHTTMVRIPAFAYVQQMHSSNSQDLTRKDIQRRVRSIMYYYNEQIAKRFEEFGLEDWAYNTNPSDPLNVESRFGAGENYVNLIYELN